MHTTNRAEKNQINSGRGKRQQKLKSYGEVVRI